MVMDQYYITSATCVQNVSMMVKESEGLGDGVEGVMDCQYVPEMRCKRTG